MRVDMFLEKAEYAFMLITKILESKAGLTCSYHRDD